MAILAKILAVLVKLFRSQQITFGWPVGHRQLIYTKGFLMKLSSSCLLTCSILSILVTYSSASAQTGIDKQWSHDFNNQQGWNQRRYYSTIQYPDVNGDGRTDVCGRGRDGIYCALSNGNTFARMTKWSVEFGDGHGWGQEKYYSTIQFPDVNKDGRADICGRGRNGIYCALSSGRSFALTRLWSSEYSDSKGWGGGPEYYGTIAYPDLNNDKRADICGRRFDGIVCALSTGSTFSPATLWTTGFSDADGWNRGPEYYSTIQYQIVTRNGKEDICGRGPDGIYCAYTIVNNFGIVGRRSRDFGDNQYWNSGPWYYSTIRFPDINNDGSADVCGRGTAGIHCAVFTVPVFGTTRLANTSFSNANRWDSGPEYYSTIQYLDINGDNRDDVCGRGEQGMYCAVAAGLSPVITFPRTFRWNSAFSDRSGWNQHQHYSTIKKANPNGDNKDDVCGRGLRGIYCVTAR